MPTYGYNCPACENSFEVFQKITDEPIKDCPKCGGEVRKLLYPVGIVFKGSGFHINDYRKSKPTTDDKGSKPVTASKDTKETKETPKEPVSAEKK